MMISDTIALLILVLGTAAVGVWWGYETGVKDTEKRWSDAVARADWHRKHGGAPPAGEGR